MRWFRRRVDWRDLPSMNGSLDRQCPWPSNTPDPEAVCHRCGGPNVIGGWSAASPLWNAVMRGGSINGDEIYSGIVCPTCFCLLAQLAGVADRFKLDAVPLVELETVTPSGRVWDPETFMWVEPTEHGR